MGAPILAVGPRAVRYADLTQPVRVRLSDRISDDAWPGVIVWFGRDVRLVVDDTGERFRVQRRRYAAGGAVSWDNGGGGRAASTLAGAVRRWLPVVPELRAVAAALPPDAREAHPAFVAALDDLAERLALCDLRMGVYCRAVARDGQMRVVVDHSGAVYAVQQCPHGREDEADAVWRVVVSASCVSPLVRWLSVNVFDEPGQRRFGKSLAEVAAHRARAEALFSGLPEVAADGDWEPLPRFDEPFPFYEVGSRLPGY